MHDCTCYQYVKCLYCKKDSLKFSCEYDKNILPITQNYTKLVSYAFTIYYNTKFNDKQIEILKDSKKKYNYNTEFTEDFKFSFCSACNSKWYCVGKTKSTKAKLTKLTKSKSTKSISSTATATEYTTFETNCIINISETDQLIDSHTTKKYNTNISKTNELNNCITSNTNKRIINLFKINKLDDYTVCDINILEYDELEDLLNNEIEELDLENEMFRRQLD
ncbi:25894_t:CDS:2, partial [Racocetra persica]